MSRTFETLYRWITPYWLREGDGDAVLRSLTRLIDENVARFRTGLNSRFPTRCDDDTLAQIGADRGIIRGRAEVSSHYAHRLVAWRSPRGHRVRGGAFALLEQVSEYFGTLTTWALDYSGNKYTRTPAGIEAWASGTGWDWDSGEDPTPSPEPWARFWLVIDGAALFAEHPDMGDPALWGGAWGTPDYTIGQTGAVFDDAQAIRRMLTGRAWKMEGSQEEWLVVSLVTPIAVAPDGWYKHWSRQVAGVQTPTRDPDCRYWSLDPEHNNAYAGYPDRFCLSAIMPDGSTYAGDPTSFPTALAMPDGSTYAGDPTKFPVSVRLVDDGDPTL
jgi:hypothetical protein